VRPSRGSRVSLSDLQAIAKWVGAPSEASTPPGLARKQSGFIHKAFAWTESDEVAWVERGADPFELPDGYFELPNPPRFIGPAGVWKYTFDVSLPDTSGARYVRRSAGYERVGGTLAWCEENDRHAILGKDDPMPRAWTDSNRAYRIAEERWGRAWAQYWWRQRLREGER
jgi:hypothetical protein